jgi:predicted nucleic-acid-binding Zn-ribbon protein
MSSLENEVSDLRAELAAMRQAVEVLQKELLRAQQHVDVTMRNQLRCRACGCRKIAHALKVLDRADGDSRKELALNRPSWWSPKVQGVFEVYVCTKCGLAEWWVKDASSLQPLDEHLEFLDGDGAPAASPYR